MSSTTTLPDIQAVPSLSTSERVEILDLLFEPCTQLHTLSVAALQENSYDNYGALVQSIRLQLFELLKSKLKSDQDWLEVILAAHPRLGEKKVESAMSKLEQAGLQGEGQAAKEETEKLRALNQQYEEKFPGLRYVTFVNGRSRPVIMQDMQTRIDSSNIEQEKLDAINAMCDIALDRAKKLGAAIS